MAWGQEQQSREAALAVLQSITQVEKDLARLQAQQENDNDRYGEIRAELSTIREVVRELELGLKDYQDLLGRVQFLETTLTTFGADFGRQYLSKDDFERYCQELDKKKEHEQAELATAEAQKIRSRKRQIGIILGGFVGTLPAIAPKLWELVLWLLGKAD